MYTDIESLEVLLLNAKDIPIVDEREFTVECGNNVELLVEIIGKRQYSRDLPQGRMELPALYVFKTTNLEMHLQLPSLARKAMKTYNDAKTKAMDKPKKRNDMYI